LALDEKDEALLAALGRNARASVVDLARQIGLSRSATQDRLARLERTGAIAGYTVRRGSITSRPRLHAWLLVRYKDAVKCAHIVPQLRRERGVMAIFTLSGDPDVLVEVEADNTAELDALADRLRAIPGIARVTSHIVLAAHRP
jgi:Lrp/AsnC family transcriptional regulator, leucine-responsive regulatory protein